MEDFRLFLADLESAELGSVCKAGRGTLQGSFSMRDKGSISGEEEASDQLLKGLSVGLQPPEAEKTAIKVIANVNCIAFVKVFCGLLEQHAQEDADIADYYR